MRLLTLRRCGNCCGLNGHRPAPWDTWLPSLGLNLGKDHQAVRQGCFFYGSEGYTIINGYSRGYVRAFFKNPVALQLIVIRSVLICHLIS